MAKSADLDVGGFAPPKLYLFAAKNMETSAKAVFAVVILGIWCYFMSTLTVNMLKKQHTRAKTD